MLHCVLKYRECGRVPIHVQLAPVAIVYRKPVRLSLNVAEPPALPLCLPGIYLGWMLLNQGRRARPRCEVVECVLLFVFGPMGSHFFSVVLFVGTVGVKNK